MQSIRTTLFVLFVCLAGLLHAQTTTGSVSGTITDPNGASIPDAKITATETASGRSYTAETTAAGLYVLPALPVGKYTIAIEHVGFKKRVQNDVEVRVALREQLDVTLEIGEVQ